MKQILQEISQLSLLLDEENFTDKQRQTNWLGKPPATDEEISQVQDRLQINLPEDYVDFLKICNGFSVHSRVHPSFAPASQIDYLKNIDEELIDIWESHDELKDVARALAESIKVGGFDEEQYFLLIPPNDSEKQWRYWKFASWIPGESPFNDLTQYFSNTLEFIKKSAAEAGLIESDIVIDYSLRDQLFLQDWEGVFTTAADFFLHNKKYHYFNNISDLLTLLHLSASKLNRYEELEQLINKACITNEQYKIKAHAFAPWKEVAKNKVDFLQRKSIVHYENAPSLEKLLEQTKLQYPHLFNNEKDLVTYLLIQLFEGGKAPDYIQLYENNRALLPADYHLKAAVIYAEWKEVVNARQALNLYFDRAFSKQPLAPFNYPELLEIMDKEYLHNLWQQFKQ